jgi:hypothetical protein
MSTIDAPETGKGGAPEAQPKRPPMNGGASPVYALGMIGALVYYWRRADGSPDRARAVGKALVWPAFVVHDLLRHLEG